jgi:uncharacterized protein (DUF1684 family)
MKKILAAVIVVIIAVTAISIFSSDNIETFREEAEKEIETRKRYLKHNEQSPFAVHDIPYEDPTYYPYDPEYRVEARINRDVAKDIIRVGTSDGKFQAYTHVANLDFTLKGRDCSLILLKPRGFGATDVYYLAFADDTSGDETYGGGRYMDVKPGKSDKLILDFNLAYNPYCAYAPEYSCPLPPSENILSLPVTAGEKKFKSSN